VGAILDRLKDLVPSIRAAKERNGIVAASLLLSELQRTVGVSGTARSPSRVGQPPHKRTGHYQSTIFARWDKQRRAIVSGSTDPKLMRILEYTRPHFAPTIQRVRPRMLEIMRGK
jgi:hypothetical protein